MGQNLQRIALTRSADASLVAPADLSPFCGLSVSSDPFHNPGYGDRLAWLDDAAVGGPAGEFVAV